MSNEIGKTQCSPFATEEVARLGNRIGNQLSGRVREFRLELSDAGIVLRGQARTYHAKQLAQHAVMSATIRPILGNQIEVL